MKPATTTISTTIISTTNKTLTTTTSTTTTATTPTTTTITTTTTKTTTTTTTSTTTTTITTTTKTTTTTTTKIKSSLADLAIIAQPVIVECPYFNTIDRMNSRFCRRRKRCKTRKFFKMCPGSCNICGLWLECIENENFQSCHLLKTF